MYPSHHIRRTRTHRPARPPARTDRHGGVSGRRLTAAGLLAVVAVLAPGLGRAQTAAAADTGTQTVTFGCVGFPQEFNVPPGVTEITAIAQGAAGAGEYGGRGGVTEGFITVRPGDMLSVTVGCRDGYGLARGGAGGAADSLAVPGKNGGGSSGITDDVSATPRLVAGGGGESGRGLFIRRTPAAMRPPVTGLAATSGASPARAARRPARRARPAETRGAPRAAAAAAAVAAATRRAARAAAPAVPAAPPAAAAGAAPRSRTPASPSRTSREPRSSPTAR
jgi:hypothetical protein